MATAVAARTTAKSSSIPPSSPFSLLLRRSRFASYDPAVKQTYSAPAAHAHRGDWGLKRPLALKRKNVNITLESYEHHAQFVEWNPADSQVRLVKRVEEMGAKVKTSPRATWYKGLGKAQTQWLIDSEFAPGEGPGFGFDLTLEQKPDTVLLDDLGNKGPGGYGASRPLPSSPALSQSTEVQVMPNIHAMSPKEFKRYLAHLRSLRPEFKEFITTKATNASPDKSLYEISQTTEASHHRHFLRHHAAEKSKEHTSLKFEPQPHPSGGLQYTHPTPLSVDLHEKFYSTTNYGMVLHPWEELSRSATGKDRSYAASYGGLVGQLRTKNSVDQPFLFDVNTEEGLRMGQSAEWYERAMPTMKIQNVVSKSPRSNPAQARLLGGNGNPERGLVLRKPPVVVGRRAQNGVEGIELQADLELVYEENGSEAFGNDNPWEPGTTDYIAEEPRATTANRLNALANSSALHGFGNVVPKKKVLGSAARFDGLMSQKPHLLNTLKHMVEKGQK